MVALAKLQDISSGIARKVFGERFVERTMVEPDVSSFDEEIVRVTVVLKEGAADEISGDQAVDIIGAMRRGFEAEGEERRPSISYATEDDLRLDEQLTDDEDGPAEES